LGFGRKTSKAGEAGEVRRWAASAANGWPQGPG
jgi:hypothetical protein